MLAGDVTKTLKVNLMETEMFDLESFRIVAQRIGNGGIVRNRISKLALVPFLCPTPCAEKKTKQLLGKYIAES